MTTSNAQLVDAQVFRLAMRRVASTVAVVATGMPPDRQGMTATAVCSLTAEPAQVLACLNVNSRTCEAIRSNGSFSVNFLDAQQASLARRFAGQDGAIGDDKFSPDDWCVSQAGVPLLRRAIATMACHLRAAWQVDTHVICVGAVSHLELPDCVSPLLFQDGRFGTWAVSAA